jgi:hypothetical protein
MICSRAGENERGWKVVDEDVSIARLCAQIMTVAYVESIFNHESTFYADGGDLRTRKLDAGIC